MTHTRHIAVVIALLVSVTTTQAQHPRLLPLGFAGTNAVVLDLASIRRTGDIVEASTQVWSDSVFVVDGVRATRRDDRYRVHCGISRIFGDGSVYRDSIGGRVGQDESPVEPPPPESWAPLTQGSMLATVATYACFPDVAEKSRLHRVLLLGEQDTQYLRTIPSSVTVMPGDSVVLMRRNGTPIKVRYGRPEQPPLYLIGEETDVSYQLDQVSRERAVQNILWVANPKRSYPNGFLAFQVRTDGREFILPIRLVKSAR